MTTTLSKTTGAPSARSASILNGIDVDALRGTIEGITKNPKAGNTEWAIRSVWKGGTRSDHHVRGCGIGCEYIERPFVISVDEPLELCGTNQFANPQEYLLAAMNACMMVGYAAVGALMGIRLTKLEVRTEGSIDLRGFLGIEPSVAKGYPALEQTVTLSAPEATREQIQKLHETVKATSPNFYNITTAVPVESRVVIEK